MRQYRKITFSLSLCLLAPAALAADPFKVYCAQDKITVDQRTFAEMKKAHGQNVCAFGEFDTAAQAASYGAKFGGEGAKCSCR
ncbi:MAG: hypothetical protein ACKVON_16145 [Beijerinckiaceae bacterium]